MIFTYCLEVFGIALWAGIGIWTALNGIVFLAWLSIVVLGYLLACSIGERRAEVRKRETRVFKFTKV